MMVASFWKLSNLYKDLKNCDILQKPIVEVSVTLYLILDYISNLHIFAE